MREHLVRRVGLVSVLFLSLLWCSVFTPEVMADEPIADLALPVGTPVDAESVGGVDIVFLLDNSDDMYNGWGANGAVVPGAGDDPDGMRFAVVEEVLARLTFDTLHNNPDRVHRVGLVPYDTARQMAASSARPCCSGTRPRQIPDLLTDFT